MRSAVTALGALLLAGAAGTAGIAGCGGSGPGGGISTGTAPPDVTLVTGTPGPAASWPVYGGNPQHAGDAAAAPAGTPRITWRAHLDGAVYGQPLLVGDLVIAATENDTVYALDAASGHVTWRTHLGTPVPLADLPCGNIDPLGITSTPAYDQADGLVYVLAETTGYHHVLTGLGVTTGTVQVRRDIPAPDGQPRYDQQRPGLVIEDGRVYIAFGGLYGDCGPYRGSVVAVPLSGNGPILSYVVPTAREGAIWGTAGPVAGSDGTLYVSTGNGAVTSTSFDGSDAVTALDPALHRTGIFAPSSWLADSKADADLGSTQPALLGDGRLLALGKSGTAYLLNAAHLGGVGGQLASLPACPAYGAAAVAGSVVYEPCAQTGLTAIDTAGDRLRIVWHGPANATGSPVVGGGAVWVIDPAGGTLYVLNQVTGAIRHSLPLNTTLSHFASLSLSGQHGYIGTNDGVIAFAGA